jgi:YHS domain-containing protein
MEEDMMTRAMLALCLGLAVPALAGDMDKGMTDKPMDKGMETEKAMEPAVGGHCPVGLSKGVLKPGDPMYSTQVGDKTYHCSSAAAHEAFKKNPKGLAKKAEKAYKKMMKKKDKEKKKMEKLGMDDKKM